MKLRLIKKINSRADLTDKKVVTKVAVRQELSKKFDEYFSIEKNLQMEKCIKNIKMVCIYIYNNSSNYLKTRKNKREEYSKLKRQ